MHASKTYLAFDLYHQHFRTILLPADLAFLFARLQLPHLVSPRFRTLAFVLDVPVHHNIGVLSGICGLGDIAYRADGCYAVEDVSWRHGRTLMRCCGKVI